MTDDAADRTMDEVDHTHPHTDAPFGDNGVYDRGPEDASERAPEDATDADDSDDGDGERRPVAVRREDDDGEPIRTDGGTDGPYPQPTWAVQGLSDRDR